MNKDLLKKFNAFHVVSIKDYMNIDSNLYMVIMKSNDMTTIEYFTGTYEECLDECQQINQMIVLNLLNYLNNVAKSLTEDEISAGNELCKLLGVDNLTEDDYNELSSLWKE